MHITAPLAVEIVRALRFGDPAGGPSHLSAASGLVVIGDLVCVVADDEHSLGLFDLRSDGPGRLLALFDEALPDTHDQRKALKADLESLARLPPFEGCPNGVLLAAGSGSKPNRHRGVVLPLDVHSALTGEARVVDLAALHAPLQVHFAELNIEGLFVDGDALCLLQRGSRIAPANACIRFELAEFARWLAQGGAAPRPRSIDHFELGSIAGVPLTFTDGAALPSGGWVFCAAAEDTRDSYLDGQCVGSAIGVVDSGGRMHGPFVLAAPAKVEGIAPDLHGQHGDLLLVTDADDRQAPALLLRVSLTSVWP